MKDDSISMSRYSWMTARSCSAHTGGHSPFWSVPHMLPAIPNFALLYLADLHHIGIGLVAQCARRIVLKQFAQHPGRFSQLFVQFCLLLRIPKPVASWIHGRGESAGECKRESMSCSVLSKSSRLMSGSWGLDNNLLIFRYWHMFLSASLFGDINFMLIDTRSGPGFTAVA